MIVINCEQRSTEWYAARCGVPTASAFDKLVTSKGELSAQRKKYLLQLAGEKATGTIAEGYRNAAMENGIVMEDEARRMYELITGCTVEQVGFCKVEGMPEYGCSPDGMVEGDGILEVKCPLVQTHVEYFLAGKLPTEYIQQVQGQLFVTGRKWCDFMSYFPLLKPLIVRVYPDLAFHTALKTELGRFCEELNQIVERIKS